MQDGTLQSSWNSHKGHSAIVPKYLMFYLMIAANEGRKHLWSPWDIQLFIHNKINDCWTERMPTFPRSSGTVVATAAQHYCSSWIFYSHLDSASLLSQTRRRSLVFQKCPQATRTHTAQIPRQSKKAFLTDHRLRREKLFAGPAKRRSRWLILTYFMMEPCGFHTSCVCPGKEISKSLMQPRFRPWQECRQSEANKERWTGICSV